jgi:hypothetical protein
MQSTSNLPDPALIDQHVQLFFSQDTAWASFHFFKELLIGDSVMAAGVLRSLMQPEHEEHERVAYILHNFDGFFDHLSAEHPEFLQATRDLAFPIGVGFQKKALDAEALLASLRLPEVGLDVLKHICLISAQLQRQYDETLFDEILEKIDSPSLIKVIDSSMQKTTQGYTHEFHTFVAEAYLLRLKPGKLKSLFFGAYPVNIDSVKHKLEAIVAAIAKHQGTAKPEAISTLVDLVWDTADRQKFAQHEVFTLFKEREVDVAVFAHKPETQAKMLEVDLGL